MVQTKCPECSHQTVCKDTTAFVAYIKILEVPATPDFIDLKIGCKNYHPKMACVPRKGSW